MKVKCNSFIDEKMTKKTFSKNKNLNNLIEYVMWLPFSGMMITVFAFAYLFLYEQYPVTWQWILYACIPIVLYGFASIPVYKTFQCKPVFLNGKWKWVTGALFLVIVAILLIAKAYWSSKQKPYFYTNWCVDLDQKSSIISIGEFSPWWIFFSEKKVHIFFFYPTQEWILSSCL